MKKNEGYTVIEIVVSGAIFLMLMFSYVEASILLRDACYESIMAQELQRDADIIIGHIVKNGPGESPYPCKGLRSAASYDIPDDSIPPNSKITFIGADGVTRAYYLENGASRIIYKSPTISGVTKTVYTAPPGTTILLEFTPKSTSQRLEWVPEPPPGHSIYVDNPPDGETVGIHLALTRTMRGKTYSGSLWTYENLRNCSK